MLSSVLAACLFSLVPSEGEGAIPDLGFELVRSIPVEGAPYRIKFSPDGQFAFIGLSLVRSDGTQESGHVAVLNCDSFKLNASTNPRAPMPTAPTAFVVTDELAFHLDGENRSIVIADRLNEEEAARVEIGAEPIVGVLSPEETDVIFVCSNPDSIVWINTASFEVVSRITEGVGPGPRCITVCPGGEFALIGNRSGGTVSVLDLSSRKIVDVVPVDDGPVSVDIHPNGREAYVACEIAGTICVLSLPAREATELREFEQNQVLVLGTIHGGHETSERYDLKLLDAFIREVSPDYILAEIPPNRARAAMEGFLRDGRVSEPRVMRFPEYLEVVYPLTRELDFEIIPTAGWTEPMSRFRSNRLREISEDSERAEEWAEYQAASLASEKCQEAAGSSDDPYFVNSAAYDECAELDLAVYDRLFNEELGPGGWTAINESHYGHIADALDKHTGRGKRFLVTYGAGHKGWFLRELRKRTDIELIDVKAFLERAEKSLGRR